MINNTFSIIIRIIIFIVSFTLCYQSFFGFVVSCQQLGHEAKLGTEQYQDHYLLRRIKNRHFLRDNHNTNNIMTRNLAHSCNANSNCIGLEGDCCPTSNGIYLDCCGDQSTSLNVPTPATTESNACSAHPNCNGLSGICCPNNNGIFLDCCGTVSSNNVPTPVIFPTSRSAPIQKPDTKCSAYPSCNGLSGNCCPNSAGSFLECCDGAAPVSAPTKITPSPTNLVLWTQGDDEVPSSSDFGPNVIFIDNTLSTAQIQGLFDDIFNKQVNDEMGTNRFSIYFRPGVYGTASEPLMLQIGYYTEVAGIGINPTDVVINGKIEVYNRCFEADPYQQGKFIPTSNGSGSLCFALNNFWRSLANLSINIISLNQDACRSRAMFWAISQASSMRRVNIQGGEVSLMDYCTQPGYASGGFIADSRAGKIFNGSQQQFFARNLDISEWDGGIWNQVFMGVNGAPDDSSYPDPPYTTFSTTPLSREKPYLFADNGQYYVRVPSIAQGTKGTTWSNGQITPGESLSISTFFVVTPSNTAAQINRQLSAGKNLLFTPGVYDIETTIYVRKAYTVILGLGHATLTPLNGIMTMQLTDKPGIIVAGLTFDAGLQESDVLLQVGEPGSSGNNRGSQNPITLSDLYFRVGGPHIGKADLNLEINSDNVLIDHTWIWRADHGIEDFNLSDGFEGDNERWETNIGRVGLVVNGNSVTAMGLFVEHYQQYNVEWNGNNGHVYFFQNELPYDPPTQAQWTTPDGTLGYAAYKVSDAVTSHELWGGGVYCYNRNNPNIITAHGFETPVNSKVQMHRLYTRNLSGPGTIQSVINGVGTQVDDNNKGPEYVKNYSS